jgi:hypothetical protein
MNEFELISVIAFSIGNVVGHFLTTWLSRCSSTLNRIRFLLLQEGEAVVYSALLVQGISLKRNRQ